MLEKENRKLKDQLNKKVQDIFLIDKLILK